MAGVLSSSGWALGRYHGADERSWDIWSACWGRRSLSASTEKRIVLAQPEAVVDRAGQRERLYSFEVFQKCCFVVFGIPLR